MWSNKQHYYPLQKMVDDVPSIDKKGHKKEKKHKRESKEEMPSLATTVNTQTSPDFTPEELLTELGFDLSRTAPTATSISAVDEKNDLNVCLFLRCNLAEFHAQSNMDWYIKYPMSPCGLFSHKGYFQSYMEALIKKVHAV